MRSISTRPGRRGAEGSCGPTWTIFPGWRHGFGADCRTRIGPGDESGTRRLAGYLARAPFSLERLELTDEGAHYRPDRPNLFLGTDEVRSDRLEMIALVT